MRSTCWNRCKVLPPRVSPAATWSGTPLWRALWMPTKRRATMSPDLSLAVQYATPADQLPRWRLRAWVMHALRGIAQSGGPDAETLRAVVLTLRLVDADEGQRLNREFRGKDRSEEHTSELQSLMRTSYAVLCLKKKKTT